MQIKNQIIGKRSKSSGSAFERLLSLACDYYLDLGIAYIEKTPEPFHIISKDNMGLVKGFYEKKGQPDYKGVLCDGSGIVFEAKHTDSDTIKQSVITETQWKSLDIYEKFGAHCYVIVSIGFQNFYRVPWDTWKRMKELYKHKYMNTEDLLKYKLKYSSNTILFLEGVEINAY